MALSTLSPLLATVADFFSTLAVLPFSDAFPSTLLCPRGSAPTCGIYHSVRAEPLSLSRKRSDQPARDTQKRTHTRSSRLSQMVRETQARRTRYQQGKEERRAELRLRYSSQRVCARLFAEHVPLDLLFVCSPFPMIGRGEPPPVRALITQLSRARDVRLCVIVEGKECFHSFDDEFDGLAALTASTSLPPAGCFRCHSRCLPRFSYVRLFPLGEVSREMHVHTPVEATARGRHEWLGTHTHTQTRKKKEKR